MDHTKKIRLATKLYPFYEATSGDLVFFSVIQTLFLTLAKGFSPQEIATLVLITDIVDLALEYPSYRLIRRIGNSRSVVIGGFMPLIGILLITFGSTSVWITIGNVFCVSAMNFQSMASAGAKNNLMLLGEKDRFAKLFSKSNIIYSAASMTAAVLIPFLFSVNRYLPTVLCIIVCAVIAFISFFVSDHTERGGVIPPSQQQKRSPIRIGKGLWLLVVVFCLFFCAGAVFTNNTELFLSNRLKALFTEQKTIFIYGAIIWAARVVRLISNIFLSKMLELLKSRIVIIASLMMLASFAAIGCAGLLSAETLVPILLAGLFYVLVKGVFWDPLRTFLRMAAVDTNSKKRQQSMLVLLNVGQSVTAILMDLIVVGVLKLLSLEYVFISFAVISILTAVCAVLLHRELRQKTELLFYEMTLNESEIDTVSQKVFDSLTESGTDHKEALSYRFLLEEKLIECMQEGKQNETIRICLFQKMEDIILTLKVGNEERDVFSLPQSKDSVSQTIFSSIMRQI